MRNPVAIAIVIAGALVGLGLYLGLRARAPVAAPRPGPAAEAAPVPPPHLPSRDDPDRVRADAVAAVERFRQEMLERCWRPALAQAPQPATSTYQLDVSFSGNGVESARGVSELREQPSRGDVARCLRDQPIGTLRIPPPGGLVRYELPLRFP